MSQHRWMWLNIIIYFFSTCSHQFDWDKENIYRWHGAFRPYVIPGAKWNMISWGKMALLWGKMEQRHGAKWHILTNACVGNLLGMFWWIHVSTSSAEEVRNAYFFLGYVILPRLPLLLTPLITYHEIINFPNTVSHGRPSFLSSTLPQDFWSCKAHGYYIILYYILYCFNQHWTAHYRLR